MAKAKKLPSGSWRVNLYTGTDDSGKRIYKSFTADTKKEAEFLAAEYNLKRKEKPKGITVGDAIDGYIASKENVLSPSSIESYKRIRRTRLQFLMDVPLEKLDQIKIQVAVNSDAMRLSPKSVQSAHGLLVSALKMYLPDFTVRTTLPAKQKKIKQLPEPSEVIQAVRGTDVELPVMMALWLGMRLSEIQGLRFSDVSGDTITISHVRLVIDCKYVEKDQTKTYESTRVVRAPEEITKKIREIQHENESDYIFQFKPGGIYKRFQACIKRNGLAHMSFHDLRHMNASIMLALGIPDKYAMERGGWSTPSVMKSVYQHTFSDERVIVDQKIDGYFREIL